MQHGSTGRSDVGSRLPELGVGLIYSTGLLPLLEAEPNAVDVLEIEPQTTWLETDRPGEPYLVRDDVLEHLVGLPGRKLVHSIGTPVGGSVQANAAQYPLLRDTVQALDAPWASEHLSFNLTPDFFTGFFLPPRQTEAGVEVYVDAIRALQAELGLPLAVETGVNYLRPRAGDLPDGAFMAEVADRADCGILLDLHNIYCNDRNGRQSMVEFVGQLPLDRVWEVHLAGGFEMDGFWLDAHSGEIPAPLVDFAGEVVSMLPNLKAIIFELFGSFIPHVGVGTAVRQLDLIRDLWDKRGSGATGRIPRASAATSSALPGTATASRTTIPPAVWEAALGGVVVGRPVASPLEAELAADPGVVLVQKLVKEFRGSMVVSVYRLTCRLLMLALGADVFRALLEDFWSTAPPRQYAAAEADAFAGYLLGKGFRLPQFEAILNFERAALRTMQDGIPRIVRFSVPPLPMLQALADGRLLTEPGAPGDYEIEVRDQGPISVSMPDLERTGAAIPFH